MKKIPLLLLLFIFNVQLFSQDDKKDSSLKLTIYNNDLGVVKEIRKIDLKEGQNQIKFIDVSTLIDSTSVVFRSLTDEKGTTVIEQNFDYDLVSSDKLIQKYLDKKIRIITKDGDLLEGILLSNDRQYLVVQLSDGSIRLINREL